MLGEALDNAVQLVQRVAQPRDLRVRERLRRLRLPQRVEQALVRAVVLVDALLERGDADANRAKIEDEDAQREINEGIVNILGVTGLAGVSAAVLGAAMNALLF